jgi:hypothetical protein
MVSYFAVNEHMGFVRHMLMATILGEISPWRCWQAPNPGKKLFQLGLGGVIRRVPTRGCARPSSLPRRPARSGPTSRFQVDDDREISGISRCSRFSQAGAESRLRGRNHNGGSVRRSSLKVSIDPDAELMEETGTLKFQSTHHKTERVEPGIRQSGLVLAKKAYHERLELRN